MANEYSDPQPAMHAVAPRSGMATYLTLGHLEEYLINPLRRLSFPQAGFRPSHFSFVLLLYYEMGRSELKLSKIIRRYVHLISSTNSSAESTSSESFARLPAVGPTIWSTQSQKLRNQHRSLCGSGVASFHHLTM